jgi:DNA-binding response OmpR family regulator
LRRVVIIDDELAFSTVLAELVSGLGFEVAVSSDPSSSHTHEVRDSDIVFIDVLMPHVSGFQVLEQLARQNVKSAIVIMSGQGERLDEAEKLAHKLDLYLIGVLEKPFHLADLLGVLEGA